MMILIMMVPAMIKKTGRVSIVGRTSEEKLLVYNKWPWLHKIFLSNALTSCGDTWKRSLLIVGNYQIAWVMENNADMKHIVDNKQEFRF